MKINTEERMKQLNKSAIVAFEAFNKMPKDEGRVGMVKGAMDYIEQDCYNMETEPSSIEGYRLMSNLVQE